MCSHHHQTIKGVVHVGYVSRDDGRVIGLSKLNRIVEIIVGGNPNIWEDELNEYLDDPTDEKKEDLNKKLRLLLKELCLMPEYYLS